MRCRRRIMQFAFFVEWEQIAHHRWPMRPVSALTISLSLVWQARALDDQPGPDRTASRTWCSARPADRQLRGSAPRVTVT